MKNPIVTLLFGVYLFSSIPCSDAQDDPRYVLLRSGKIIEGKPTVGDKKTRIELTGGDYFVIPNEKVEKSFRRRKDIFNYKSAITPIQTNAQNHFLQWILSHKNHDFAIQHLRELSLHTHQLPEFDFDYWLKAIQSKKLSKPAPSNQTQVAKSNAFFKNKVENHLVLGCALSGCHRSPSDSSFALIGLSELDKQNELSNLAKTKDILNQIGKKSFLNKVSQKHGVLRAAMYPAATSEYLEIATWVNSLDLQNHPPRISIARNQPQQIKSIPKIENYKSRTKNKPKVSQATYEEKTTLDELEDVFVPRDEFDPEIFNRLQKRKLIRPDSIESNRPKPEQAPERLISNGKQSQR